MLEYLHVRNYVIDGSYCSVFTTTVKPYDMSGNESSCTSQSPAGKLVLPGELIEKKI